MRKIRRFIFLALKLLMKMHIFHENNLVLSWGGIDFDIEKVRGDSATFLIHGNELKSNNER